MYSPFSFARRVYRACTLSQYTRPKASTKLKMVTGNQPIHLSNWRQSCRKWPIQYQKWFIREAFGPGKDRSRVIC